MPLYEYECENGHRFDEFRHTANRYNVVCPECTKPIHIRISLSSFRMGVPATIRFSDGRIFAQKPDGGAVPPICPPTTEQRDKARVLQGG